MSEIRGGCLCGGVRFRATEGPVGTRICWCRDCQALAAGSGTVNVVFRTEAFEVEGETRDYVSTADSGAVMHRRFCPACGTPLFSEAETRPHLIIVRAGALDDPELARPASVIWTASAPSWAAMDETLPRVEGQPPPIA